DEVGYIKISRFSKTTYSEFRKALQKLKSKGMKKLMMDLRGTPGGYLDKAVKIADEFIAGNDKLVYTDGKGIRFDSEYRAKDRGLFEKGPIIVLIDEESASASEIVAGALQDHDRALLVGRRSFGKGLVQLPIDLNDGSELRLTISRYYTPSGRSIQKPYNSYQTDLLDRYNSGELFNRDSIKVNDSLRYKTSHGRIVYGGGGIIPDYFVPLDTGNQHYFTDLIRNNIIGEYVLDYSNQHKSKIEAYGLSNFQKTFLVDEVMMQELVTLANQREVTFDKEAYTETKDQIRNYVKAQIARRIWSNEGFYSIIHNQDPIFNRAVELFSEAEKLEKKKFDQLAKDQ
ncbi:MAG: S41 family peptidase, partial [Bacteroidota bacterium]